jgi:hypothetical protein
LDNFPVRSNAKKLTKSAGRGYAQHVDNPFSRGMKGGLSLSVQLIAKFISFAAGREPAENNEVYG